jgi:ubiquinone/menaquinone biosynthesis C-methylase UbiE
MEKVIAPQLRHAQTIYPNVIKKELNASKAWLDLGCGSNIFRPWAMNKKEEGVYVDCCSIVVGLDRDFSQLRAHRSIDLKVQGDIANLPFRESAFDIVTANMVVEHLAKPEVQFLEVNRVLKPQGVFVFHTMNTHCYLTVLSRLVPSGLKSRLIRVLEGREEQDVFPTHYLANSENKIRDIVGRTNFEMTALRLLVSSAVFIVLPPVAFIELLLIRLLMFDFMRPFRTNIICILTKQGAK